MSDLGSTEASSAASPFRLAARAARLNPSIIREILKLTQRPGVISLAGGLPAAELFPVGEVREAADRVLRETPREALQYAPSEGFEPLREWVAQSLQAQGVAASAGQVLITNGSQQGLDLIGKVLLDPGSTVAVESPTYLGALQAFAPFEPEVIELAGDADGPTPEALRAARGARFAYLLPNFQNPSGHCLPEGRRAALVDAAREARMPIVEDDPYGELWYDAAPPPGLVGRWPEGVLRLGSFSKVLVPGLRLGWLLAPPGLFPKLLQAKQAADLHTTGFNQRVAFEVLRGGLLERHLPIVRARYRERRDAMADALRRHLGPGWRWETPGGGMFFWLEGPTHAPGLDTLALLPRAVERGVAFVPGAAFYADAMRAPTNRLRLSFVTVEPAVIEDGVARLARVLGDAADAAASDRASKAAIIAG
ncbi:MAG: PLP-dependent aminotransferase family protein [Ideonella sp.]|nr:PLP-dependent aminotransferase family protein [Ideonella sp.]